MYIAIKAMVVFRKALDWQRLFQFLKIVRHIIDSHAYLGSFQ